jgi:hypothetical protein
MNSPFDRNGPAPIGDRAQDHIRGAAERPGLRRGLAGPASLVGEMCACVIDRRAVNPTLHLQASVSVESIR